MKVVIISCFAEKNNYNRGNFVYEYFNKRNDECYMVYSMFQHSSKKDKLVNDKNWIPINTVSYSKNVSIKRILSHIVFGVRAAKALKKIEPDIVYMAVPPNSVTGFVFKMARRLKMKTIIDIVDMWPESFPTSSKVKKVLSPFMNVWMKLRDDSLKYADALMFECNLYKDILEQKNIKNNNSHVIHLAKNPITNFNSEFVSCIDNTLNICYLGSINLLIDIELIIKLLQDVKIRRKINMHIIGIGDKKEYFLSQLSKNDIKYIDYGPIYDEEQKNKIMSFCDFGINLYRENTMIGLTYKSVDYFSAGLPIINSIKSDTWAFVENEGVGINCNNNNFKTVSSQLINLDSNDISLMKKKAFSLYMNKFENSVVEGQIDRMVETILPNK